MPNPGQANNPGGANGYEGPTGKESPYGAVKRLTQQTKAAPLPGNPALGAPRRASRAAQRGGQQPAPAPEPAEVFAATPTPYPVAVAQTWAALAADPEASDLVRFYAQQAAQLG